MQTKLSRRTIFKLSGGLLAAAPLVYSPLAARAQSGTPEATPAPTVSPVTESTTVPEVAPVATTVVSPTATVEANPAAKFVVVAEPTETTPAATDTTTAAPAAFVTDPAAPNAGVLVPTTPRKPFGRAMANNLPIRETPDMKGKVVRNLKWNDVIPLTGQVVAPGPTAYNPIWYQTTDGYIHSAFVYPSENTLNAPIAEVPEGGLWAEVSVPVVEARVAPNANARIRDRFVYALAFKVVSLSTDDQGQAWYQLDDTYGGRGFYAPAEQIRILPESDFTPISPEVPLEAKRMEVDLKNQVATAYEYDKPVFNARVATGLAGVRTTPGQHRIFRKIVAQRMYGGTAGVDYYNLPGIPWVSYFTTSGIAFHGSYWHNDYGRPRSHGCVNMYADDAKWVFRWTSPVISSAEKTFKVVPRAEGSLVHVF